MARKRNVTPSYVIHAKTGRGRLVWYDSTGVRQQKLLPGAFNSPESLTAKAALELELLTSPTREPAANRTAVTVAELLIAYLDHAERYYRDPDGKPASEITSIKRSIKPVRELYAALPAAEFGPRALAAVRQRMIDTDLCRNLINKRIDRVKRVFKWAASEELVPVTVYQALRTLTGLRAGRTAAKESEPVRPVDDATVDATLPHLPRHLREMVELIRYTGMRQSEVCAITLNQIERGTEWPYHPVTHKTAHRGKRRAIPFGPRAHEVLTVFLAGRALEPDEPLFSPRRANEERFAAMRVDRKSKVPPSQMNRKKAKPKRKPADRYTAHAITHAVAVAAEKAGVPHWHPYQLRHAFATKARKAFGLEHAGAALGHTKMSATEVYAERDATLAAAVAAKIG